MNVDDNIVPDPEPEALLNPSRPKVALGVLIAAALMALSFSIGSTLLRAEFWPNMSGFLPQVAQSLKTTILVAVIVGGLGAVRALTWSVFDEIAGEPTPGRRLGDWLRARYQRDRTDAEFDRVLGGLRVMALILLGVAGLIAFFKLAATPLLAPLQGHLLLSMLAIYAFFWLPGLLEMFVRMSPRLTAVARRAALYGFSIGTVFGLLT